MFIIAFPLALVNSLIIIDHDADSMSFAVDDLTVIDRLLILFKFSMRRHMKLGHIDNIALVFILLKECYHIFNRELVADGGIRV
jgi:hypothetical protein